MQLVSSAYVLPYNTKVGFEYEIYACKLDLCKTCKVFSAEDAFTNCTFMHNKLQSSEGDDQRKQSIR